MNINFIKKIFEALFKAEKSVPITISNCNKSKNVKQTVKNSQGAIVAGGDIKIGR